MIWIPNGIGCLLAISQLCLYFTFHPVPLRVRVQKAFQNLDVLGLGLGSGSGSGLESGLGSGFGSGKDSVKGRVGPTGWATEAGSKKDKLSRREEDGNGDGDVGGVKMSGVEMGWDDHHVTASAPVTMTVTVTAAGPVPPSVSPPISPSVRPQPGATVRPDTSPETSPESSV
jgi:hypothetical protein